jgi:hypothetical protein
LRRIVNACTGCDLWHYAQVIETNQAGHSERAVPVFEAREIFMSSDTWQVVQAFFILTAICAGLIAYGVALGRKEQHIR